MKLEITSEKVLEAAETCPDAGRVLRTLFPAAFKPKDDRVVFPFGTAPGSILMPNLTRVERRGGGSLDGSIYLPMCYRWSIETDNEGAHCLVARPR